MTWGEANMWLDRRIMFGHDAQDEKTCGGFEPGNGLTLYNRVDGRHLEELKCCKARNKGAD